MIESFVKPELSVKETKLLTYKIESIRDQKDFKIRNFSGGETSSVIGTILSARKLYSDENEARKNLFFVFNNPQTDLLHLDRARLVLEDSFISKIELCTGPQAVTGSTRMQATTIETFVIGIIFEEAIKANEQMLLKFFSLKTFGTCLL